MMNIGNVRHVLANFRKSFNAFELKFLFWATTKSIMEGDLIVILEEIKKISKKSYD